MTFRRQHAIGRNIVDFCCPSHKLVIELDGRQHLDQADYDANRSEFLESRGFRVIRFWNDVVLVDIEKVIASISFELNWKS